MAVNWTECDELAEMLLANHPAPLSYVEAEALVRFEMPSETQTMVSNVAQSIMHQSRSLSSAG